MSNAEVISMRVDKLFQDDPAAAKNANLFLMKYWMKYDDVKDFSPASIMGATPANEIMLAYRSKRLMPSGKPQEPKVRKSSSTGQGFLDLF